MEINLKNLIVNFIDKSFFKSENLYIEYLNLISQRLLESKNIDLIDDSLQHNMEHFFDIEKYLKQDLDTEYHNLLFSLKQTCNNEDYKYSYFFFNTIFEYLILKRLLLKENQTKKTELHNPLIYQMH